LQKKVFKKFAKKNLYDKMFLLNLIFNENNMELKLLIHIWDELENSKEVIERIVEENLKNKLDRYLKKFEEKKDAIWTIDFKIDKNKKDLFNWILQVNFDWQNYRYSREDFKKLDDLINHLFDHLKEDLSDK
jgi:hypothetical protein